MKKKIKDLTIEEYDNICDNAGTCCKCCPFEEFDRLYDCRTIKDYIKQRELNKMLEQEIEVKENE